LVLALWVYQKASTGFTFKKNTTKKIQTIGTILEFHLDFRKFEK
jgi:hypothetical protein